MCGRYALDIPFSEFKERFNVQNTLPTLPARYNVAPGSMMPVILRQSPNTAILARWGLIPSWARDPNIGYRMINARGESLVEKPAFRKPLVSQRCLVPASGFYEWGQAEKEKIPYYVRLKTMRSFSFAGLYDTWRDIEGKELQTFTIITTTPNALIAPIHNRMPVILPKEKEEMWVNKDNHDIPTLISLLEPYPEKDMEVYPVSKAVNNPENDNSDLVRKHVP